MVAEPVALEEWTGFAMPWDFAEAMDWPESVGQRTEVIELADKIMHRRSGRTCGQVSYCTSVAMPAARCQRMWQCKYHVPGLLASKATVTLDLEGSRMVSRSAPSRGVPLMSMTWKE